MRLLMILSPVYNGTAFQICQLQAKSVPTILGNYYLCQVNYKSRVSAYAPHSTLSSTKSAGTTSRRAADHEVTCLRNSARRGTNSRSPAFEMPPPITILAGF